MAASAQQSITPGATPEPATDNWTYWLGWLVAPASLGLILLIGFSFARSSSRFFAREEPSPPERRRPRYPTGAVAPPVGLGPRVEQLGAASTTPPAAPASEVTTAKEQEPKPTPAPTPERKAPAAEGTPAATAEAEAPAETAPAPRDEPAEAPKAEAAAPAQAPAPAPAAAPQHVEPDQEAYERELKAQLDKGTDRRVAEGRAKAAAVRAAKAKAAGAAETPAPEAKAPAQEAAPAAEPAEEAAPAEEAKEAAEASAQAQAKVTEPEVVEGPTPAAEAKQAEEPPREVEAPAPAAEAKPAPAEPAEAERPAAPPGGDEETFNRILEEQLGKGLARPIAESRARAAAIKAAREKSGG
jgi:hypothetical protein